MNNKRLETSLRSMITISQVGVNPVNGNQSSAKPEEFDAHLYFKELEGIIAAEGEKYVKLIQSIYRFKVKNKAGKEGIWTVDAKNGKGQVFFGPEGPAPAVTFTINDEDIGDFLTGNLDPQKAYFQGRLKIAGSIAQALRLKDLALKHKDEVSSKL